MGSANPHVEALKKTAANIVKRAKQLRSLVFHADSILASCRAQYDALRYELSKYGVSLPEFDEAVFSIPRVPKTLGDLAQYISSRDVRARVVKVVADPAKPEYAIVYLNKQLPAQLLKRVNKRLKALGGELIDGRSFRIPKTKAAPWIVA